jgi:glutamine amidotransferase-like uncharacterized protein
MTKSNVVVYAGHGASHSWTWLADLFESKGVFDVRFLDSAEFVRALDDHPTIALISGGDGFAIASSLLGDGFTRLEEFVDGGGLYVGICAGAYLPLTSSVPPFSEFNLSSTKIENIDCNIRPLDNVPPRVAVKYGRCAVVHPVRSEIELRKGKESLSAPLYGGPIFKEPSSDEVLMRYFSFTPRTEFQFSELWARQMVIGKPAALLCRHGDGRLLLLGPHLEHPRHREANNEFLDLLGLRQSSSHSALSGAGDRLLEKVTADLKVAIVGLENRSFVVGKKLWDGSRYLELVHAVERSASSLRGSQLLALEGDLRTVRDNLVHMEMGIESDVDSTTELLVQTARKCVDQHFRALAGSR